MFETLVVAATLVFACACRTFAHPAIRKVGALAVVGATFLVGYFASGGQAAWGAAAAAGWFLLPWLDLLTRIRGLRLPLDKKLRASFPPGPDTFPQLRGFTGAVEDAGFEHVSDSGWEWDGMEQFVRFFYDEGSKAQATINLNRQRHVAFAYMSISSRTDDGKVWTTWNYPFGYSMRIVPELEINRARGARSFAELADSHRQFLARHGIADVHLQPADPEQLSALMEREMRAQVDHNLDRGLIKLSGNGTFRYSWRGLVYLWLQSVKDMVRLS